MPGGDNPGKLLSIYLSECNDELEAFLLKELTGNRTFAITHEYDVVVIAQGVWEAVRKLDCVGHAGGGRLSTGQVFDSILDLLEQLCREQADD